jgi:hypothetical protein
MAQYKVFFPKTKFVEEVLVPELMAFRPDADNKSDNLVDALTNGLMMLGDLIPGTPEKEAPKDLDIVPGSWEDLARRKHYDPRKISAGNSKSLFAWRKSAKKSVKFY